MSLISIRCHAMPNGVMPFVQCNEAITLSINQPLSIDNGYTVPHTAIDSIQQVDRLVSTCPIAAKHVHKAIKTYDRLVAQVEWWLVAHSSSATLSACSIEPCEPPRKSRCIECIGAVGTTTRCCGRCRCQMVVGITDWAERRTRCTVGTAHTGASTTMREQVVRWWWRRRSDAMKDGRQQLLTTTTTCCCPFPRMRYQLLTHRSRQHIDHASCVQWRCC
jgi:hypothetical protein